MKASTSLAARRRAAPDRGVVLLALLLALALAGIALLASVDVWSLTRQREREAQLLFAGDQYREAIRRYYYGAPAGTPRILPASLDALLEDDRYPMPVRYLRRPYPDPITGRAQWGEVRDGSGIVGVYSLSEAEPLKQDGFAPPHENFSGQSKYSDWVFAFTLPRRRSTPAPAFSPGTTGSNPFTPTRPVRGTSP